MFALVIFAEPASAQVPAEALTALREAVVDVPGLAGAMLFTPAKASDLYVDDGQAPPFGMQLHFKRLEVLEAACTPDGAVAGLLALLPALADMPLTAQAFWRRTWQVPDSVLQTPSGALPCSYVVHYPGPAADTNAWHDHYLTGHPPLFQRFPGIRMIEIMTPVEWVSNLPLPKAHHMQRNRVMFDSPEALTAALQSPVRHELRADFHSFPPFEGGNFHYPMWTEMVRR